MGEAFADNAGCTALWAVAVIVFAIWFIRRVFRRR